MRRNTPILYVLLLFFWSSQSFCQSESEQSDVTKIRQLQKGVIQIFVFTNI